MNKRVEHIINAKGVSLGRVATQAANFLQGKHKVDFVNRADRGEAVKITNYSQIIFTGNKLKQKFYYRPTTRPGKLKSENLESLWKRRPKEVLRQAIWGMLPKNSLRKEMIKRLLIEG